MQEEEEMEEVEAAAAVAASGTDKTGDAALLTWPRCGGARNVAIREG